MKEWGTMNLHLFYCAIGIWDIIKMKLTKEVCFLRGCIILEHNVSQSEEKKGNKTKQKKLTVSDFFPSNIN